MSFLKFENISRIIIFNVKNLWYKYSIYVINDSEIVILFLLGIRFLEYTEKIKHQNT